MGWLNTEDPTYKEVIKILNKYDLEDLMVLKCPEDEYDIEAVDILNRCHFIDNIEDMSKEILSIFNHWFSTGTYDKDILNNMSQELINLFNED